MALLVFGATAGMADVAMNAQGVVVEQRYGRSIMSGLHGLWSAGGLIASGVGALAAHADVDPRLHFLGAAAVLCVIGALACRRLLDIRLPDDGAPAFALPSRAVLLIGLVGFCAIFAEGGTADWCAVYLRTVTGAEPGLAAAAYTGFALAMTGGRLVGDRVVRRFGAVATVRVSGGIAVDRRAAGGAGPGPRRRRWPASRCSGWEWPSSCRSLRRRRRDRPEPGPGDRRHRDHRLRGRPGRPGRDRRHRRGDVAAVLVRPRRAAVRGADRRGRRAAPPDAGDESTVEGPAIPR